MRRVMTILVVAMMSMGALAGLPAFGGTGHRGLTPMGNDGSVWTDSFDDQSNVYVPTGGLAGVDVTGGEVRLAAGKAEGWVASTIIPCPAGLRYDIVLLSVVTPGASSVRISILDPAVPAPGAWAANGTIDGYTNVTSSGLSLTALSQVDHPGIRLQATLVSKGTDRPRLLAWALHFVDEDGWQEDFISTSKVNSTRQVSVSGGRAHLDLPNLTKPPEEPAYEPFPPIFLTMGSNTLSIPVFYPNVDRTGYRAVRYMEGNATGDVEFDDIDGDGKLDMVMANTALSGVGQHSEIRWGTGEDPWNYDNVTTLWENFDSQVISGDFNGDGEKDLAFPWALYLNQGQRLFNDSPDVSWIGIDQVGDINNDGYDDIQECNPSGAWIYYGRPQGPDIVPSLRLNADRITGGGLLHVTELKDINRDGYLDVLIPETDYDSVIYLGGPDGPDTTVDKYLWCRQDNCNAFMTGDLNNDGYTDIIASASNSTGLKSTLIYWGSPAGWNRVPDTEFSGPTTYKVFDVNKDGYDDLISFQGNISRFLIFYGGDKWDWIPDINKDVGVTSVREINVAVPKHGRSFGYAGALLSEPIKLPVGKKWDLLMYDAVTPPGTDAFISVLGPDNRSLSGMMMLSDRYLDLSALQNIPAIQLKFTFRSRSDTTTASVGDIIVRWMDTMTWKDEFYSDFRAERLLHAEVSDGQLWTSIPQSGPQLLFTGLRRDGDNFGYTSVTNAYVDAGAMDYTSLPPVQFNTSGVEGASVADVNGDGYMDLALAVLARGDYDYSTNSPLYLGSCVGYNELPAHIFGTTGASDVLLRDLNGDGNVDVVFSQERNGTDYNVDSILFWGSKKGWNSTPDVRFSTRGASGIAAADLDGDGRLDLAFSCFKNATSTSPDSMVFLQGATGFDGTVPSHRLPTRGARAVAAADLNGDGLADLAFANSVYSGDPRVDSYIYWGKAGGGFLTAPKKLPTVGAEDVKAADLDGDGTVDLVFANFVERNGAHGINSYVYLNDGTAGFPQTPSFRIPTMGAKAVEVADLDGSGFKDLAFACQYNGTNYTVPSLVYLGGAAGWASTPDIQLPTEGASDVVVADLLRPGHGGYISRTIEPGDPVKMGTFHTFKYNATLAPGQTITAQIVDAESWEVLASTSLKAGTNEWRLAGLFRIRDHPAVRVVLDLSDPTSQGDLYLDYVWLNWTLRSKLPPGILGIEVSPVSVLRLRGATVWVDALDEWDATKDLVVSVQHRLVGSTEWLSDMVGPTSFVDGRWTASLQTTSATSTGNYSFRARAVDKEGMVSEWTEMGPMLRVLNNIPTAPEIEISPKEPLSTDALVVRILQSARDFDGSRISYRYVWFRDGELVAGLISDTVLPDRTSKGENWSVVVRAFDGEDEGPPATAWALVRNAPPALDRPLVAPSFDEDTVDTSLDLSTAAKDPDGDPLVWALKTAPEHLSVTIAPATGVVTLRPDPNWFGTLMLTFTTSDGEYGLSVTVNVTVLSVNDLPWFVSINGGPVGQAVQVAAREGEQMVVTVVADDVEGDALTFGLDTTDMVFDPATGEIRWTPKNEDVGERHVRLTVHDAVSPDSNVTLDVTIVVANANNPPADPKITEPLFGFKAKVNETFNLSATCGDPDEMHGQALTYSWSSNASGLLGQGQRLPVKLNVPGVHIITLTVSDGEFTKTAKISVTIEALPPVTPVKPTDGEKKKKSPGFEALAAVTVLLMVAALARRSVDHRRR